MKKENEEQPDNNDKPEEKPVPEADPNSQQPTEQAPNKEAETKDEGQTADAQKTSEKPSQEQEAKGSKESGATEEPAVPEFIEKVISINRITKVTKGGKKLSFSALVVVGDTQGNVGYCLSKAAEVSIAIRKAMGIAKKNMVRIPMHGTTIPHEIIGRCSGSRVLLKPASDGTGVIASGPVRAVCDGAGIHNILTKCHRSNNPINVVKATMDGLMRLKPMTAEPQESD